MIEELRTRLKSEEVQSQYDSLKAILDSGEATWEELYDLLLKEYDPEDDNDWTGDVMDMLDGWCSPDYSLEHYKTLSEEEKNDREAFSKAVFAVQDYAEFEKHLDPIGSSDILSDLTMFVGLMKHNGLPIDDPVYVFDTFWEQWVKPNYGLGDK